MVSMLKLILNMVGALLNAQIYNMLFNNHFSTGKLKKAFNFIDVMLRKDDFMDFAIWEEQRKLKIWLNTW